MAGVANEIFGRVNYGDRAHTVKFFKVFKTIKPNSLKFFSDEAYGFITCGAEPPHKVKVNIKRF
jgi:hypothetical protein